MRAIEARQRQEVASDVHPLGSQLSQLRAIGLVSAWKLDKELFGGRSFTNRRQLGASLGLTPTPYDSGNSQIEQGISKAGNKRLRSLLVELAWSWLRYQPDSALSHWYGRRFATAGKRKRRVGIVAPRQAAGHCAVAIPAARRDPARGNAQAGRDLKPIATQPALPRNERS